MCGVLGIYSYNARDVSDSSFDNMVDSLAHRGPDGSGVYRDPKENLRLGHRRLSILDTSESGAQPMPDPSHRYWITFDGEIYNFLEIREELEKKGYVFRTESDTEVALYSFIEWKEDCQLKFNGLWGLVIWDQKEKRCFFSRDRFGEKPLYIFDDGKRWAFASELKAFLHVKELETGLDEARMAKHLSSLGLAKVDKRTILKNVYQVSPGHCGWFDKKKKTQIFMWWKTWDHIPEVPKSKKEKTEAFRELVIDAVRVRMRSDVPIGGAISGGLDSTSIFCCMSHIGSEKKGGLRQALNWKNIFSIRAPGTSLDEGKYVDFISSHLQIKPNYCLEEPHSLFDNIKSWVYHNEGVVGEFFSSSLMYRAFRKKNITVSLEGHGADRLLVGDALFIKELMRDAVFPSFNIFRFLQASRMVKSMYDPIPSDFSVSQTAVIARFIREYGTNLLKKKPGFYRLLCFFLKKNKSLEPSSQNFLFPRKIEDDRPFIYTKEKAENPMRGINLKIYEGLCSDETNGLRTCDRSSMEHGVQVRLPFLDWRVVVYSFALEPSMKVAGGYTKKILRDAMEGILPDFIRLRKSKLGLQFPFDEWLRTDIKKFVLDSVHDQSFLRSSIWNGPLIRDFVQEAYRENDMKKIRLVWKYIQASYLVTTFKERSLSKSF